LYSVQAPGHCAPPREGCTAACVCRSIDGLAAAVQAKGLASGSALPDLVCGNPLLHRVLCPPFRHSLACLVWLTRSCVLSEATNRFHVHWHVGKRHPPLFTPFSCCSPCLVLCLGLVPTAACYCSPCFALPCLACTQVFGGGAAQHLHANAHGGRCGPHRDPGARAVQGALGGGDVPKGGLRSMGCVVGVGTGARGWSVRLCLPACLPAWLPAWFHGSETVGLVRGMTTSVQGIAGCHVLSDMLSSTSPR
jgi:hypothetical protein